MKNQYTDDEVTLLLAALLKEWNIRYIVASPGTLNAAFNLSAQQDSFFKIFSAVDERGAAYMATGLAYESGRPVVITCTGATASRNYLPALTEAYYRKLPIIAITFSHDATPFELTPQATDRTVSQNDIKTMSVFVTGNSGTQRAALLFNAAFSKVMSGAGPVHINVCADYMKSLSFHTETLPKNVWKPHLCTSRDLVSIRCELEHGTGAVFVGSHRPFTEKETEAISEFALSYDIPVFVDSTSNYHGANRILISQIAAMTTPPRLPEWIVDIGGICGDYAQSKLFSQANIWRISPGGEFMTRVRRPIAKLIHACEEEAFRGLRRAGDNTPASGYYSELKKTIENLQVPELPFSAASICHHLAQKLPHNSTLHLGILNSLRAMDFFSLHESIRVNCNVGGFGIDGPLSTLVGQSWADPERPCYAILGDLAFFYDMNALGNRHLGNNVRILLINNGRGEEFRLNQLLEKPFAEDTDKFVAASGHFAGGARAWAESCGFRYMRAQSEEEFLSHLSAFCTPQLTEQPLILECFTTNENEQLGMRLMYHSNRQEPEPKKPRTLFQKIARHLSAK